MRTNHNFSCLSSDPWTWITSTFNNASFSLRSVSSATLWDRVLEPRNMYTYPSLSSLTCVTTVLLCQMYYPEHMNDIAMLRCLKSEGPAHMVTDGGSPIPVRDKARRT